MTVKITLFRLAVLASGGGMGAVALLLSAVDNQPVSADVPATTVVHSPLEVHPDPPPQLASNNSQTTRYQTQETPTIVPPADSTDTKERPPTKDNNQDSPAEPTDPATQDNQPSLPPPSSQNHESQPKFASNQPSKASPPTAANNDSALGQTSQHNGDSTNKSGSTSTDGEAGSAVPSGTNGGDNDTDNPNEPEEENADTNGTTTSESDDGSIETASNTGIDMEPTNTVRVGTPGEVATTPSEKTVAFDNCTDAWLAGVAPITEGRPGYEERLDRDGDGVACDIQPISLRT